MKIKDVIELNGNRYVIISIIKVKNIKYAYIINKKDYADFIFIEIIKDHVKLVEENKLKDLIKLFNNEINKEKLS